MYCHIMIFLAKKAWKVGKTFDTLQIQQNFDLEYEWPQFIEKVRNLCNAYWFKNEMQPL